MYQLLDYEEKETRCVYDILFCPPRALLIYSVLSPFLSYFFSIFLVAPPPSRRTDSMTLCYDWEKSPRANNYFWELDRPL
jgi:hypothetical protein